MRTEINLVDTVKIAAPCSAAWEAMHGDEQKRFCEGCGLHVHNLSAMTRRSAQALLETSPEQLCIRYGQRPDGTVVTDNCPPRLRSVRSLMIKRFTAIASFGLLLFNLTCRTVEAMQRTQTTAAKSKTAAKKKPAKPAGKEGKSSSRLPVLLGRTSSKSHAAPAATAPLKGKSDPEQSSQPPLSPKGDTPNAGGRKSSSTATPKSTEATKETNATVFTLGTGVHF